MISVLINKCGKMDHPKRINHSTLDLKFKKIGDEKCFKVRQCQAIDIVGYVITLIKSCVLAKFYSPN